MKSVIESTCFEHTGCSRENWSSMHFADTDNFLTIGTLAELTGCNVATIRYYEEIGLLPAPRRRDSGHRVYEGATVDLLRFIRHCRDFGFPIEDIRTLISLSASADRDCGETRAIAQVHLDSVRSKLAELSLLEQSLARCVDACSEHCATGPAPQCSIFEDLSKPATKPAAPKRSGCCG